MKETRWNVISISQTQRNVRQINKINQILCEILKLLCNCTCIIYPIEAF